MRDHVNKTLFFAFVALALAFAGCTQPQMQPSPSITPTVKPSGLPAAGGGLEAVTVQIKDFAFSPEEITIKRGTTVKWINLDSVGHTATADNGGFDSGLLAQNQDWGRNFDSPGVFEYHCVPHPNMKAKIIVE